MRDVRSASGDISLQKSNPEYHGLLLPGFILFGVLILMFITQAAWIFEEYLLFPVHANSRANYSRDPLDLSFAPVNPELINEFLGIPAQIEQDTNNGPATDLTQPISTPTPDLFSPTPPTEPPLPSPTELLATPLPSTLPLPTLIPTLPEVIPTAESIISTSPVEPIPTIISPLQTALP